ncbi:uncharacterized protein LOC134269828 [Saccostrea cucullata]|uniref:uncharacterized protein LOC134269828 n=1 Tax=Saccostrea cuccullata TaxID=36930 RepID=UPI002ED28E0D
MLFCLGVFTMAIFSIILRVERIVLGFHIERSIVSIIWNVLLIVFASGQIFFISLFYKLPSIVGNMRIYYGINFVILSNVCLWFNSIVAEEVHLFHIRIGNTSNENNEMETFNCTGATQVRCVFENVFPYLLPITAQYSLVSISFVLNILSKTKQRKSITMQPSHLINEYCPLLECDELAKLEATTKMRLCMWYICVVIGVTLVSVLLILVAVLMAQPCNEEKVFRALEKYRLFYKAMLLLLASICFRMLWSQSVPTSTTTSFSSEEVILVFSSTAKTMYLLFKIHAIVNHEKIVYVITMVEDIVSLLIVYYQTVFVLQSRRYQNFKRERHFRISHVILLMFIMNLGLWFNDGFLQKHVPYVMKENNRIFDRRALDVMNGTLFPISEFYMFQLSLAFFDVYCRFRT